MSIPYDQMTRAELIALLETLHAPLPTAPPRRYSRSVIEAADTHQTKLMMLVAFAIGAWAIMIAYVLTNATSTNWFIIASTPLFSVLAFLYWLRWQPAPHMTVFLFVLIVGLLLPEPYVTEQVSMAIFLAPVLALVLLTPRWMVLTAMSILLIMLIRADWQGAYANPIFLAIFVTLIGGLLICRRVLDLNNKQLEALNRTLEQRIAARTNELQRTLQELRNSEARLRTVVTNLPIVLLSIDQRGIYTLAEGRGLELLGTSPAELLGQSIYPTLADHPEIIADMQRALAGENFNTIHTLWDQVFETWYTPLHEADGSISGISAVSVDITARQRAEAELRIFRSAVDTAVNAIAIADLQGMITYVNLAFLQLWGNTVEQTLGQSVLSRWQSPNDASSVFNEILRNGHWIGELALTSRSGLPHVLQVHANIVTDETDQPIRIMASFIDISERKRAENEVRQRSADLLLLNQELARVAHLKDEFLANMSHELRTPLTSILGRSELLQEDLSGTLSELQRRSIRSIEESGRHLLELINDILDLSKVEAGKMTLDIQPVRITGLIQACIRMISQTALKKRLHVHTAIDDSVVILNADPRRLKQILVNLLANAVKFTPEGGEVGLEVRANPAEQKVELIVWDTGIGISSADQARLFQPFMQIDSGLARQYEGTGLGLALVAQLTALHGGQVQLTSVPGFGSRFTISLPWDTINSAASIPAPSQLQPVSTIMSGYALPDTMPLILVVDDNIALLTLLAEYLALHGFRVAQAQTGREAIIRAQAESPACIIMDIQMPELDGLTAIRLLRQDPASVDIPILVLSAHAMSSNQEQALAAGANAYMSKPVKLAEMVATIALLISPKLA